MENITKISGKVIPLPMDDVDTDLIIPAQFLVTTDRSGYGKNLFRRLCDSDPQFVFNQQTYSNANILVAQKNFACGSSREHAVWALLESGIQAVIAESFPDIFSSNSAKNGLILIQQPKQVVKSIIESSQQGNYFLDIDIAEQLFSTSSGDTYSFELDPFHQYCFLNGMDELDYLIAHRKMIDQWKATKAPYHCYTHSE